MKVDWRESDAVLVCRRSVHAQALYALAPRMAQVARDYEENKVERRVNALGGSKWAIDAARPDIRYDLRGDDAWAWENALSDCESGHDKKEQSNY
jgi:hypothetical protein